MNEKQREMWKPIKEFPNYEVSNLGRIRSLGFINNFGHFRRGQILKPWDDGKGYLKVELYGKSVRVHRLVAKAFVPNPENKSQVNHKDGNPKNNKASNLEWVTNAENTQHAYDMGLARTGFENPRVKLSKDEVEYILKNYVKHSREFGSTALAKKFNVSATTILDIVKGKPKYMKEGLNE